MACQLYLARTCFSDLWELVVSPPEWSVSLGKWRQAVEVVGRHLPGSPRSLWGLVQVAWMFGSQASTGNFWHSTWRCEPPLGSFIIWDNAAVIVMVPHITVLLLPENLLAMAISGEGLIFTTPDLKGLRSTGFFCHPLAHPIPIPQ